MMRVPTAHPWRQLPDVNIPVNRPSLLAFVVVGTFALGGCQSEADDETPSPSASVAPSTSASTAPSVAASTAPSATVGGEDVSVFDLEAGDCFSADAEQLESVLVVDCAQPHVYEAFHVFDHEAGPDDAYPGDDQIVEYADAQCQPPFEEFVGTDYESSIWYITSVTPSSETWAEGDREIVCTLNTEDESEVTGSAEGSAE